MADAYDVVFRERAVAAYNAGEGGYHRLARVLGMAYRTLQRWVAQERATGSVAPRPKGGGWRCPINTSVLMAVVREAPDATIAELCWEYNRRVKPAQRSNPTSFGRAMRRSGFVLKKKRPRPSEIDRPDVAAKRAAFLKWVRRINPRRLIFVDEAGANIAMGRSHAWVLRGEEYMEARPMNWGDNLTLVDAGRREGWVTLSTQWCAMNGEDFVTWVRRRLAPRLQRGDIVLLDNLKAHKAPAVRQVIERRGATGRFLPPYSHDFNPIEPVWALVKQRIRAFAPRTAQALRRVARAARHVVRPITVVSISLTPGTSTQVPEGPEGINSLLLSRSSAGRPGGSSGPA